jgi:hypothetical protein
VPPVGANPSNAQYKLREASLRVVSVLQYLIAAMNSKSSLCDDTALGPSVHGCRGDFDFTIAFEQYFFSIVPSAILLLTVPWRFAFLGRHRVKVTGNGFRYLKLVHPVISALPSKRLLIPCD